MFLDRVGPSLPLLTLTCTVTTTVGDGEGSARATDARTRRESRTLSHFNQELDASDDEIDRLVADDEDAERVG